MNKLISSVFAETTFQYCNVVPLHVEGGEAAAVKWYVVCEQQAPWEMFHIMVHVPLFLVDDSDATAINLRHVVEMGLSNGPLMLK